MTKRWHTILYSLVIATACPSFALRSSTQWFSEETVIYYCEKICYDPGTGDPFPIRWEAAECQMSWWGVCTPDSCNLSCYELFTGHPR